MMGSSPSLWSSQSARWVSRGCSRSQARATAVPYRVVWVMVVTAGAGQLASSASLSSVPCREGRPRPGRRGGGGKDTPPPHPSPPPPPPPPPPPTPPRPPP